MLGRCVVVSDERLGKENVSCLCAGDLMNWKAKMVRGWGRCGGGWAGWGRQRNGDV